MISPSHSRSTVEIQLDHFRGCASELAGFCNSVWAHDYEGRMAFPMWSSEYFNWQLRLNAMRSSPNLIAAYDQERLIGLLLGVDYNYRTPERRIPGSLWSWMTIHPDYRGLGIARMLDRERVRRLQNAGREIIVSYRYFGSSHSLAEKPKSDQQKFARDLGFWVRVIDAEKMWQWDLNRIEGALARMSSPLTPLPDKDRRVKYVRRVEESDLPACLDLIKTQTESMALAVDWDLESLRHHLLGSSVSHSYLFELEGQILGFMNFHVLPYQGRIVAPIGVIDMIAIQQLPFKYHTHFINAVLSHMKEEGAILAMKLRCGDVASSAMLRTYFLPRKPDSHLVLQMPSSTENRPDTNGPLHLLWR